MKIQNRLLGLTVLIVIFGGIGLSMAFNLWHTESTKVPITFQEGEFTGEYNPADIRGSYSLGETSDLFKIPLPDFVTAFGLEAIDNPADFKMKDLETLYASLDEVEIGTDSVRVFVALYAGLPYTLAESTYLPQPAVDILKTKVADLSEAQIAFLDNNSVSISDFGMTSPPEETEPSSSEDHEVSTERIIKGKTTFGELLEWGLSEEDIEAIIGEKIPAEDITARDFIVEKELEFESIKETLQSKIDSLQ
ncbi:hypothetical protein ACFLXH_03290 [Chloroflexota bacterium]